MSELTLYNCEVTIYRCVMVNFYSAGMNGNQYGGGVNVHQQLKAKYGVGYEDFGTRPYAQAYPMEIIPRVQPNPVQENLFIQFLRKCF